VIAKTIFGEHIKFQKEKTNKEALGLEEKIKNTQKTFLISGEYSNIKQSIRNRKRNKKH